MNTVALNEYRRRLTAERATWFGDWPIEPGQREACWQNLAQSVDALIALGPAGGLADATGVLQRCVEQYNELDEGYICTIEREELCDILYELGGHCGLDPDGEWVDEWRDW